MSQVGNFQILSEIARSQQAITSRARRIDDPADADGRYVIKVFDLDSFGLLEGAAAAQTFIERTNLQKRLADQGAQHWLKVVEVGTPDDPYFVTDFHPLTAQHFVERNLPVDVRALHTIVWSVVRGLTELRETFRRSHGNLKLTNILLGGDSKAMSPKSTEVVLADPSVEAHSARDRHADLLALGELIHQLVLKRPFKSKPGEGESVEESSWPVPFTAIWGKLGADGQRWLDLCNWLLSPKPGERPNDMVEVAVALHALAPKPIRKSRKWVAAAAIPLVLAGAGGAVFVKVHTTARAELATLNQQWFGAFERALADPKRQALYNTDETLKNIVAQVRQAREKGIRFDPSADPIFSYSAYSNASTATDLVQRIERDLTPDRWQRLSALQALRQRYETRGWVQPASFLDELTRGIKAGPNTDVAANIDRLMEVSSRVTNDAIWLDNEWLKYEADLKSVRDAGDPVLTAFARELRESVGESLRLTDAGFDGLDAFRRRMPLATSLAKLARDGFPKNHARDRIASEIDAQLNIGNPSEAEIQQWLGAIDQFALVPLDPKAEPVASLSASFEKMTADVKRQTLTEAEQADYAAASSALQQKLTALMTARFARKDVARLQGDIPSRAGDIQRELESMRKQWVRLDDPKQWIEFIDQPLATDSDALKARWKLFLDAQRKRVDALSKNIASFKKAKADADLVRSILAELGKQFPKVTPGLPEQFAIAAYARRERELQALSGWAAAPELELPDLEKFALVVDTSGKAFTQWCEKLQSLAKDFPIKDAFLTPADRPDQAWAANEKEFWQDPIVQELVKADVQRLNALAAVGGMSQADLVKTATNSTSTEVVFAAWKRLGETRDGVTNWPVAPAELETELSLRNKLAPLINGISGDADRKAVADEWRRQGPVRWRRFMDGAVLTAPGEAPDALEQRITTGQRYRNAMFVTDPEAEKLSPAARFNYALYIARISLTDATDTIVRTASQQLIKAAGELKDRPEVATLAKRLSQLGNQEPMAGDPRLLAAPQPETYVLPIREQSTLKFVRVTPPRQRPFYLCTTELSIGQYIELVNTTGNWTTANLLLGNQSNPGGQPPTPQQGPRAWDRPSASNGAIERFDTWRFDASSAISQPFQFATTLRQTRFNRSALKPEFGDNPKYDHPMQQLPAQAALHAAAVLNCRLPTSREWLAAYELESKAIGDISKADWNLRDKTWRSQQEFTTKEVPTQWPGSDVAGVFWPKDVDRPAAVSARSTDDQTLFFRQVTSGSGTFTNLVGNVAEFVCDQDEQFDLLPDRKNAEAILRFAQQQAGSIQVIGGSGLSAPELDMAKPYPVNSIAEPYADVGVRLAFTAPARTMAERMKYVLDEQVYLSAAAGLKPR